MGIEKYDGGNGLPVLKSTNQRFEATAIPHFCGTGSSWETTPNYVKCMVYP
jgi:hypothetical protein